MPLHIIFSDQGLFTPTRKPTVFALQAINFSFTAVPDSVRDNGPFSELVQVLHVCSGLRLCAWAAGLESAGCFNHFGQLWCLTPTFILTCFALQAQLLISPLISISPSAQVSAALPTVFLVEILVFASCYKPYQCAQLACVKAATALTLHCLLDSAAVRCFAPIW
jgi:hypothetical protein